MTNFISSTWITGYNVAYQIGIMSVDGRAGSNYVIVIEIVIDYAKMV